MIITRKIELRTTKENIAIIKKWSNLMPRLHNQIVTNIFLNDVIKDKFAFHNEEYSDKLKKLDENIYEEFEKLKGEKNKTKRDKGMKIIEKLKKDKSKYNIESKNQFDKMYKEAFGKQFDGTIYNIIRNDELLKDIPSSISASALANLGFYKKEIWKIKCGEERIKMYSKGMPIPAPKSGFSLNYDADNFSLKWYQGIEFELFFGRDKSNNRVIAEKIYDGIYPISDSSIQLKKGKIFLNLCFNIPKNENKFEEGKVVGVDLGLAIPAYCATNNSQERLAIGSYDDFTRIRTQLQRRKRNLQSSLVTAKGGHGRSRKLQAMDKFNKTERNWVKTYNHKISKAIVEFAKKTKSGVINLELLEGYGKDENGNSIPKYQFVLKNWSYFELQQFIKYKAEREGIEVKYIDPYHTSQDCSICGHWEEKQRKSQSKFICGKCKEELNADLNAAKNIAMSTKYVSKKSECQYFKK